MLSMTGQGQAQVMANGCRVQVELRSVNNRFLKVMTRCGDSFAVFSPRIEKIVQSGVRRGSVNVSVKIESDSLDSGYRLNEAVLRNYRQQFAAVMGSAESEQNSGQVWSALLALPGVIHESVADEALIEEAWPVVQTAVEQALQSFNEMRQAEGDAMAHDLSENLQLISQVADQIQKRSPLVTESYERRLLERMNHLLASYEVSVTNADLAKEVAVYADRCDIAEEIVRLRSHLEQFLALNSDPESQGRKMDFLTQEMFREVNTIGSKANDAEISQGVISIKTAIERIREMVQNIE